MKPIDQLIAELETVSNRGVRYVWFVDDNFRLGSDNLNPLYQRFVDEGLQIRWMSYMRASTLKNVDVELLRGAGCLEIQMGLESGDSQVLLNMNKEADPTMYAEVIGKLLAAGINCSCYFIFGFPGETDETALRTREFMKSIDHPELEGILSWSLYAFILGPMSPIYEFEMRKKYGLTGYMKNWKHKTMDSKKAREQVIKTFLELENSGPMYRDDNQDILLDLSPFQRKEFVITRHRLSKLAMKGHLEKDDIIRSFTNVLSQ